MANKPFDRTILNVRERPLSSDINQAQAQADRALRETLEHMLSPITSLSNYARTWYDGFLGESYRVKAASSPNMTVTVTAGIGLQRLASDAVSAVGSVVGLDDLSLVKPLFLSADHTFNVPTAPTVGQERIDIIEVKCDRRAENPTSRDVLNLTTGAFEANTVNKTLAFDHAGRTGTVVHPATSTAGLSYKQGVSQADGTWATSSFVTGCPPTTSGYVKIAEIRVGPSVVVVNQDNICDMRMLLGMYGQVPLSARVQITDSDGGFPSLLAQGTPPGIQVGTFYDTGGGVSGGGDNTRRLAEIYFLMNTPSGVAFNSSLQVYSATSEFTNSYFVPYVHWGTLPAVQRITAAKKALFVDAGATGTTRVVPLGQPAIRVVAQATRVFSSSAPAALIYDVAVGMMK